MVALIAIWGIILWRLSSDVFLDGALMVGGLIATSAFVWWTRKTHAFAERNPGLALLEGAQLLEYQRFEARAKGMPKFPTETRIHEGEAISPSLIDDDESLS